MGTNETINPGWPHFAKYTFAPAVRRGNMLFISGMTATDNNGKLVGECDMAAQTRQIFLKFGEVLTEAGATYDDIVQTTDYITTTEGYAGTSDVRREFFKNGFPASTGIIVAGLLRRGALIEIDAVAVVGD